MSTITTLNDWITGASFRSQVNTNFSNLNTDKAELSGATFTGDIIVPDEAYWVGWNGSLEVPTKNAIYDKIETMWGGGATTFLWLTDTPSSYTGQALKVVQVNSWETALQFVTLSGGWDALTANPLSQFASTTSAQLAGVISDETGSGVLVFWTDPTFTTRINVPEIKATSSSWVDVHNNSGTQVAIFGAWWSTWSTLVWTTNVGSASADYHQFWGGTGTITDSATGSSSNININAVPKWTGRFQVGWVNVPTVSSTDTITNKRKQPRIVSAASYTTDTWTSLDVSTCDIFIITAQAGALLFNAPSGTPVQWEKLIIRIKDNWTSRALTYNAIYRAIGVTLPTATTISKTTYIWLVYNSTDTKWDCIAVSTEA